MSLTNFQSTVRIGSASEMIRNPSAPILTDCCTSTKHWSGARNSTVKILDVIQISIGLRANQSANSLLQTETSNNGSHDKSWLRTSLLCVNEINFFRNKTQKSGNVIRFWRLASPKCFPSSIHSRPSVIAFDSNFTWIFFAKIKLISRSGGRILFYPDQEHCHVFLPTRNIEATQRMHCTEWKTPI